MLINLEGRRNIIHNPADVAYIVHNILWGEEVFDREKEHFWTFGLRRDNSIKYIDLISLGTIDGAMVHPRESFRRAIHEGIVSLVFVHNHPSGALKASEQDKGMCSRLVKTGTIIAIEVHDFIIVGNTATREDTPGFLSFKAIGNLN